MGEPRHHRTPDDTEGYQSEVFTRLDRVEEIVTEIRTAIVGNKMGTTGLAPRVEVIEKAQLEQQAKLNYIGAIWTAIATAGAAFGTWWMGRH